MGTAGKQQLYLKHIHVQTKKLSRHLQSVPAENKSGEKMVLCHL